VHPHRIALIADPQLVDIHTYSRRGLPLRATIYFADKYLSRAWSGLHDVLGPAEAYFLGDLFDGGREWDVGSGRGDTAENKQDPHAMKDWKRYGNDYWMKEFSRFHRIFAPPPGVRVKTGLPGNHDLGFAGGVKENVRSRFSAFFGDGNGRWEAGNHTIVMVDGVSLSNEQNPEIFGPTRTFLDSLAESVVKGKLDHNVHPSTNPPARSPLKHGVQKQQPTILLTHIPLYRDKNVPCGPLRERNPSIPIFRGYQYQNVLTQSLSAEVLQKTRARYVFSGDDHDACEVHHMYGPQGRVTEWTVKSLSWTMGVRRPGFEMVSLWNPQGATEANAVVAAVSAPNQVPPPVAAAARNAVAQAVADPPPNDAAAAAPAAKAVKRAEPPARVAETQQEMTEHYGPPEERGAPVPPPNVVNSRETLKSHLCLLPDQIGIFVTYAWGFLLTLILVLFSTLRDAKKERKERENGAMLPLMERNGNGYANGHGHGHGNGRKERDEDVGEGKYWKPRVARGKGGGRRRGREGRWWWVWEVAERAGAVGWVVGGVYLVLLWRW